MISTCKIYYSRPTTTKIAQTAALYLALPATRLFLKARNHQNKRLTHPQIHLPQQVNSPFPHQNPAQYQDPNTKHITPKARKEKYLPPPPPLQTRGTSRPPPSPATVEAVGSEIQTRERRNLFPLSSFPRFPNRKEKCEIFAAFFTPFLISVFSFLFLSALHFLSLLSLAYLANHPPPPLINQCKCN